MTYQVNSMTKIPVRLIKWGRNKSKIRILEDYTPYKAGDEIRVLNSKLRES